MNKRLLSLLLAWAVSHSVFAESFTTNIIDGFATNITSEFILGDTGPHNLLVITNGGAMTNHDRVFIGNAVEAHNNTVTVVGTGSVWHLEETGYLGLRSPSNILAVLNGAELRTPQTLAIGTYETASNNFLHVAGAGSSLVAQRLHFGTYGPGNRLLIADAALMQLGGLIFNTEGNPDGGRQSAEVRGVGTRLLISDVLHLGGSPNNILSVRDGAELLSRNSTIGAGRSTNNSLFVSGPGTQWRSLGTSVVGSALSARNSVVIGDRAQAQTPRLFVGRNASDNYFIVQIGGSFTASQVVVGDDLNATRNGFLVTTSGSVVTNSSRLTVGDYGTFNSFVVSNGASAFSGDLGLGMQYTASNNLAIATDTNTLWIANRLTVGSAGNFNNLTIKNGANFFASSLLSGGQGGSGNSTHVYGPGALLSLTNALDLTGGNSLLVTNHARVESGSSVIGSYGPSNVALISHASWSNANSLVVGSQAADNSLYASNIARLYASNLVVGVADNADHNRVHISGKGTSLRLSHALQVGSWGDTNALFIGNVAAVSAGQLHVGGYFPPGVALPAIYPADANTITIEGTNTVVTVASNISVGYNGSHNRLEVSRGADLTSTTIEVGTRANSTNNTILVTDPGTHWRNTNTLVLGSNGYRNSLIISNGARFSSRDATIGAGGLRVPESPSCTNQIGWNQVLLTGTGSLWQAAGRISIGQGSQSNSVVLTRGGTLRARDISLSLFAGACGSYDDSNLLLVDGGALVVTNEFFVVRGRFQMLAGRAEVNSLFIETGPPGRMQIFGGTLRTGRIYASAPAEGEIGDGIHRATLELLPGNFFSSGRIIIARNSVLAGRGSIGGFTNAGTFGTLRAVTAITNASLGGSSGFDVWIQGLGAGVGHSMLQLSAPFNPTIIEGRLRVALSSSFRPQPTDEFRILTHGNATGAFDNAPHNSRIKTVDNLASFLVFYTNNGVFLTDYRSTDLDGDSIEDAWATNYIGHSPLSFVERLSDSDGDGMSNYDEFRAGTDPTNAASALRVTAAIAGAGVTLRWPSVDGKTYRIYSSHDLQTWSEIVEPTFAFPEPGLCQWTDTGTDAASPTGQMRFYRVAVE